MPHRSRTSLVAPAWQRYRWLVPVVLFALPVFWKLGQPAATYHMEVLTLLSSQEVWLRHQTGDHQAWLRPTLHGQPRTRKPPATTWLHGLAWAAATEPGDGVQQRVSVARHLAALLSLMLLAGGAMIGAAAGGRAAGWMTAIAIASCFPLCRQARLASYDTYLAAFCTLASGLAVLAVRLLRSMAQARLTRRRRLLAAGCMAGAGVSLGAAVMVKNPVALLFVLLPLAAWGVLRPRDRKAAFQVSAVAFLIAAAMAVPWFVHAIAVTPAAALLHEVLRPGRSHPPWYYGVFLGMVFPWTASLIAALVLQFTPAADRRTRLMWIGLGTILLALSMAASKRQRYALPALPLALTLVALFWMRLRRIVADTGRSRWLRSFEIAHAAPLMLASLALPALLAARPLLEGAGMLSRMPFGGPPGPLLLLSAGLAVLSLLVWHGLRVADFRRAFVLTAVWAAAAQWMWVDRNPPADEKRRQVQQAAEYLRTAFPEQQLALLYYGEQAWGEIDAQAELYAGRLIPHYPLTAVVTNRAALPDAIDQVIVRDRGGPPPPARMPFLGSAPSGAFDQGPRRFELWPVRR